MFLHDKKHPRHSDLINLEYLTSIKYDDFEQSIIFFHKETNLAEWDLKFEEYMDIDEKISKEGERIVDIINNLILNKNKFGESLLDFPVIGIQFYPFENVIEFGGIPNAEQLELGLSKENNDREDKYTNKTGSMLWDFWTSKLVYDNLEDAQDNFVKLTELLRRANQLIEIE